MPKRLNNMNIKQTYEIKEISDDLFSVDQEYSLAFCVTTNMRLYFGIGGKFRRRFGRRNELIQQKAKSGDIAILRENTRFIYYLVIKGGRWKKTSYQKLRYSLQSMKTHMLKNDINKFAIPRIGGGLDGLVWEKVKGILDDIFKNTTIEIIVYNYMP